MEHPVSPVPREVALARVVRVGNCELDLGAQRLLRDETPIPLDPKAIGVLLHLLEGAPNLVSTEALLARTWQGTVVGDNSLQQVIHRLREALGDDARSPRYIETIHRRGYRLLVAPEDTAPSNPSRPAADQAVAPSPVTLAILPFADRSVVVDDPYLSEGLTLEIGSQLSKVAAIRIISRSAVAAALGLGTPPAAVGNLLEAQRVLEGAVRAERGQIRVTVQLNDVATNQQVWAATFDRSVGDILALHSDIAIAVAHALEVGVKDQELVALERVGTREPAAHRLLHRTTRFMAQSASDNRVAIELLDAAIALDPDYAEARAILAWRHCWDARNGTAGAGALAREQAERALQTDGSVAWARFAMASVLLVEGRQLAAIIELRHALEIDGSHRFVLQDLSFVLNHIGHPEEALELAMRAVRLNPTGRNTHWHLAVPLVTLGEFERTRGLLEEVGRRYPPAHHRCEAALMLVDLLAERPQAALARADAFLHDTHIRQIRELALAALDVQLLLRGDHEVCVQLERWHERAPWGLSTIAATPYTTTTRLGSALWQLGSKQRAIGLLEAAIAHNLEKIRSGHESTFPLFELAAAHALTGQTDAAIDWLERACDAGFMQHQLIRLDPMFTALRTDMRCRRLVARMVAASARMRAAVDSAGLLAEIDALIGI